MSDVEDNASERAHAVAAEVVMVVSESGQKKVTRKTKRGVEVESDVKNDIFSPSSYTVSSQGP
jgi:hypothetical protein